MTTSAASILRFRLSTEIAPSWDFGFGEVVAAGPSKAVASARQSLYHDRKFATRSCPCVGLVSHLNSSGGGNRDEARQERFATEPGQAELTEELDDRGHNIERTGNAMLAGGNVVTDDTEEAILAGVTSRSQIGKRTDVAQTRMRETERRPLPDDVDVGFAGPNLMRILLSTVDFRNDRRSVQEIATLGDNFTDLLAGLRIV